MIIKDTSPESIRANRLAWIAALESGKYEQTTGYLHRQIPNTTKMGFCCLGVMCDLYDTTQWQTSRDEADAIMQVKRFGQYSSSCFPPHEVSTTFGAHGVALGYPDYIDLINALTAMNDEGKSFIEIAAYLRKVWELPND